MTKAEFLARCATLYAAGRITPTRLRLLRDWCDGVMRLEHSLLTTLQPQWKYVWDLAQQEAVRLACGTGNYRTLANDADGYALQEITANLVHDCQTCATDPEGWWTRPGFCTHQKEQP